MTKIITLKNILILPIILSGIFIYNCTTDQNVTGYTDSENQSLAKINETEIDYEVISQDDTEPETIEIQVAPNVLNLQNNGVVVTIHTDILFWMVDVSTVYLNGIAIQSWKADNRGFFVAKFGMDAVKDIVTIGSYKLTLELELKDSDELLSGSEDILVINKTGNNL